MSIIGGKGVITTSALLLPIAVYSHSELAWRHNTRIYRSVLYCNDTRLTFVP